MPRGDKSKYTGKQKRKAEHIEEGYRERGVSEEEAERRARVVDLRRLEMAYNLDTPVPTLEQALARSYSERELEYIRQQRARLVHGSPQRCKERLLQLAVDYSADELMVLTITGSYETRLESYELLARAFFG